MTALKTGIFWDEKPGEKVVNKTAIIMPDIPETNWQMPTSFPNLKHAKCLAIDTETYDPELLTHGPGWARGKGHIVGVSVAADGFKGYYPIRHEVEPHINFPPDKVFAWLRDILSNENAPKIGANLMYDVGWLREEGVDVKGKLIDVQYAEALLTEEGKVGLEDIAQKYLGTGKESNLLYDWCARYYGGSPNGTQRKHIHKSPARLVGHYAESDAVLPLQLAKHLYAALQQDKLVDLFDLECRLTPLLIDMRFAGVTVDIDKAEQAREKLLAMADETSKQIRNIVGFNVNVNASASLAKAFDKLDLPYPLTAPSASYPDGQPSFTKFVLKSTKHNLARLIEDERKYRKTVSTFIDGYILNAHVNGKVYGQFHPLRGKENGARSGRFASSNPNLQNLSSRDKLIAPLIRGLFKPDYGHKCWRSYDYSQIEYRFLVHYAVGEGSDEVRKKYADDPHTDYHKMTQALVKEKTGIALDRKPVKNINFGLAYGMGEPTLADTLGVKLHEAKRLFVAYHGGAPFVKATMDACMNIAAKTGEITTILGRKSRFEKWLPIKRKKGKEYFPLPFEAALRKWGKIGRAYLHKALNRRLQGSAADMLKVAMVKCYEDGIFDETGVPRLTVHDENDFSDPGGKDNAFKEMKHVMETCMDLKVPILVDSEVGPNWGHLEEE